MSDCFYVYVHRRADSRAPFYVGKGKGQRAWVKQHRTRYWLNIVAKHGLEIDIVARGMDEELAHLAEMELIHKMRALGVKLTNLTDGGEGMSGFKWEKEASLKRASSLRGVKRPDISARLKGIPKSESHRCNLSAACMGRKVSEEARRKIGLAQKGRVGPMAGKQHRPETIEKIRAAGLGEKNPFYGMKHSEESLQKMSRSHTGVVLSEETRRKMSISRSGEKHYCFGKPVPEDRKAKQIASLKLTIEAGRMMCPHCSKVVDKANAKRWHFDNCKERK